MYIFHLINIKIFSFCIISSTNTIIYFYSFIKLKIDIGVDTFFNNIKIKILHHSEVDENYSPEFFKINGILPNEKAGKYYLVSRQDIRKQIEIICQRV